MDAPTPPPPAKAEDGAAAGGEEFVTLPPDLTERLADLQYQKDSLDASNADLARTNAQMDLQILRATETRDALGEAVERMETDNMSRRAQNDALRERLARLQAMLDGK